MKIYLKQLNLTNFKGIKNLVIHFNHITDIFGENAAGKTTVFDAFTWLFFDKDTSGRTAFELKPIGPDGKVSQKLDVEVSATLEVDGKTIEVKKVLHEKWVKKSGDTKHTFIGNENLYYWNDVPVRLKDYQAKIADLVNEHVFKLITNPLFFNSLKWQDRREVLLQIAGEISNEELVSGNPDFASLVKLLHNKTLEEYKKEVAAKKKKIKDDLISIPTRIDEINRNMPANADFISLRKSVTEKENKIAEIDATLQDAAKSMQVYFEAQRKQQNEIHELKTKAANLKSAIRSRFLDAHNKRKEAIAEAESEIRLKESQLKLKEIERKRKEDQVVAAEKSIADKNAELNSLRAEWVKVNNTSIEFDDSKFDCPTCERPLDEDVIATKKETMTANFNTDKAKKLAAIVEKSNSIKAAIQEEEAKVADLKASVDNEESLDEITPLKEKLQSLTVEHTTITANSEEEFKSTLESNPEYTSILSKIADMEVPISDDAKTEDNTELKEAKANLRIEIDAIKRQLNDEETIKKSKQRIDELGEQEADLAQQLANLEGTEFLADQFNRAKMDLLVERINSRFRYVTFKMFNYTIDGGEIPTCETLVNGVPFSDANNAAKINAGLDIINTLCEHYNVYAPIFIDNRESVSELIDSNSQIVNLIVSPADKKLRIA